MELPEDQTLLSWLMDVVMYFVTGAMAILLTFTTWLARRRIEFVDSLGLRVGHIEREYLTRKQAEGYFNRLEDKLDIVHRRVDDVLSHMRKVDDE